MKASSLLGHSAQLVRIIRKSSQPADLLTSSYMRDRKYIGAADRRGISAIVFLCLRMLSTPERIWASFCEHNADNDAVQSVGADNGLILSTIVLAPFFHLQDAIGFLCVPRNIQPSATLIRSTAIDFLCEKCGIDAEQASSICTALEKEYTSKSEGSSLNALSLRSCMPEWIIERWIVEHELHSDEVERLCVALLRPAPFCIRVNSMIAARSAVLSYLQQHSISCFESSISPDAINVLERVQLSQSELFKSGAIEVQDEGSQLVAFAIDAENTARILDACAGAGGKSLHLAARQKDLGFILASDAEAKRMRELYTRAQRAQLRSIHIQTLHTLSEAERNKLRNSFDIVLIDAPCSGMGTVRRSPMLKWRLTSDALQRITTLQTEIVHEYSSYVKPGGTLVYVTCSFMREENEGVVDNFLSTHPDFKADDISVHITKNACVVTGMKADDFFVNLQPHIHGTDGFFIARMKRREHSELVEHI